MKKYQAIIFDMNGVIIDDEPIHLKTDIKTCEHFGLKVPAEEWPKIKGWKAREIFSLFIDKYSESPISVEDMVQYKVAAYLEVAREVAQPIKGALDFIRFARGFFPQVALATSTLKELQEFVFERYSLKEYFDIIVTAEDLKYGKPHPDSYLKASAGLRVDPSQCLVIEDSVNGVLSGKRAGCDVIAITTTFTREQLISSGADLVCDTFAEIENALRNGVSE